MVDVEKEMLILLRQKKYYVNKMLRMAQDKLVKSGDLEKDAENFVELVEGRNETISKLETLEGEIRQLSDSMPSVPDNEYRARSRRYNHEIGEISRQILNLEEEFLAGSSEIIAHFQQKIKVANNRKRMTDTYDRQNSLSGSLYFDRNN